MLRRASSGSCAKGRRRRAALLSLVACGSLVAGLAGCSGADSGVELNGKIFDMVGMSGSAKKSGGEPKLPERAPLVPPPRTDALPAPDSAQAGTTHMAWPNDPDRQRAAAAAAAKKSSDKRCSDLMIGRPEHERTTRDAECRAEQGGLLSTATGWFSGKKADDASAATTTDEGDPGGQIVTGSTASAKSQNATSPTRTP